jgi:aspartate kinase
MKFGGTSVEDARAFMRVASIVHAAGRAARPVIVVSAMSRVTDGLLMSVREAIEGDAVGALARLEEHFTRHLSVAEELLFEESHRKVVLKAIEGAREEIRELLRKIAARLMPLSFLQDVVVSYGERLSAVLLAEVLQAHNLPARYVDARRCIVTDDEHNRAAPLEAETNRQTRKELQPLLDASFVPVLGGFIAASKDGATTTLGRGGSDYTAALIGAALDAREIQIWTDVAGILTADPRVIQSARTVERMSYKEAAELAYFGAKVLHPKTIQPAVDKLIPVRICNSRAPEETGTLVCAESQNTARAVKAIAYKTGITLVQITSARMLGAYGFLHSLFQIFSKHRIIVDVVTTSEVSVSLSVEDATVLAAALKDLAELATVEIEPQRAIICVVGEGLRTTPGVAARVFSAISDINIALISQGASSINLTFAVDEAFAREAITRLHEALFESEVEEARVAASQATD